LQTQPEGCGETRIFRSGASRKFLMKGNLQLMFLNCRSGAGMILRGHRKHNSEARIGSSKAHRGELERQCGVMRK